MYDGYQSGYDSSSESENERPRRRALGNPPPAPAAAADKKKKKKKLPPQQTIDKIWERFSQKKFSKALAVLPFSPVAPPTAPERANELVSAGFERAAEECRRKVRKIIQECKRVNMRYRDPGWDLDWDLKMSKGHCLNSLSETKFEVSMSAMINPSASIPKAVKRVHEIFEKPKFMESVDGCDVKQGSLGDCWLMASFTGLASTPDAIKRICIEYDAKIGIYGFVFFRDGEWIYSIVDDKLYLKSPCWDSPSMQRDLLQQIDREDVERVYRKTYQTGSKALFFAQNKDQNETWVPLMEKAFAKAHGDFTCLSGGWIGEGLEDLCGGVTTELLVSDILDTESFWDNEVSRVNEEFLFGCSTGLLDGGYGDRDGISEGHAYNILEAKTLKNGTRLLKLRNPWGKVKKGNWEGAWSDGSKEWTTEIQEEVGHNFGSDSVFWISYDDLLRKYQHFDRTRLFRDPDWRCCQRWIGVEVPWKASYHEKFHIKLTKESPVVLVLAQLDNRYFKGLQGQYTYRLHFRVHEQGQPGAEDYIVRSHGNYLMDRSVSVELPSMAPGNYSIFISVSGERNVKALSVEDVIKSECKKRMENEKLAQVGYAYDLAHSKAAAHLDELAKVRKTTEQKSASDARKKERRRIWEKRRLTRDIQKRQQDKNTTKQKKRKAADEAERKKKAEAEAEARKKKEAAEAEERKNQEAIAEEERKKKEAAEEEERKKNEENKPKDKAVQTETSMSKTQGDDKSVQAELMVDQDKSDALSTTSSTSSTPQDTPLDTPRSETPPVLANQDVPDEAKVVPPPVVDAAATVSGGPPPAATDAAAPTATTTTPASNPAPAPAPAPIPVATPQPAPATTVTKQQQQQQDYSDDDSSDSPIEDWEELFSSDDMTHNPRIVVPTAPPQAPPEEESEDENEKNPPWNAICVIGFRVYSKDEDLELRVVMEGGSLAEGGMGEKGAQDLDNAQANAGGARVEPKKEVVVVAAASENDAAAQEAKEPAAEKQDEEKKPEPVGDADDDADKKKNGESKTDGAASDGKDAKPVVEDGLAPYATIIRKGGEEFEKASAPVETTEKSDITPSITTTKEGEDEKPNDTTLEAPAPSNEKTGEDDDDAHKPKDTTIAAQPSTDTKTTAAAEPEPDTAAATTADVNDTPATDDCMDDNSLYWG